MSPEEDIGWLKVRFPHWAITGDGEAIRAERDGWPPQIAGNASLLAVKLSGLDTWALRELVRVNCAP